MATSELRIMTAADGDVPIGWDLDKPDEIAAAKAIFDSLTKKGYLAYRFQGDKKGTHIRHFDPNAEKIILTPALRGG